MNARIRFCLFAVSLWLPAGAGFTDIGIYNIVVDDCDRPLPFTSGTLAGWTRNATGGNRDLYNQSFASHYWDRDSAYTVVVTTAPAGLTRTGLWYSLIGRNTDLRALDFSAIFGPEVLESTDESVARIAALGGAHANPRES